MEALELSFCSNIRARTTWSLKARSFIAKITEQGNLVLCVSHKLPQQVAACYLQHEQLQQHRRVSLSPTARIQKKVESEVEKDVVCISHMYPAEKAIEET